MDEHGIFEHLLKLGKTSKDPEGVVVACLVREDRIIVSSPSSDDSQYHAEYLVIEKMKQQNNAILPEDILYTTLEPCSDLPGINDGRDCATAILQSGIKNIVYAARDPEYSTKAKDRLESAGIRYQQIQDQEIVTRSTYLFNSTIHKKLSEFKLPRKNKL